MESEKYFYQKEWEDLRNREAQYKKSHLLSPLIAILVLLALFSFESISAIVGLILLATSAGFIIFIVNAQQKLKNWQCPKCKNRAENNYFGLHGLYKDRCRFCGLEKWQNSEVTDKGTFWANS